MLIIAPLLILFNQQLKSFSIDANTSPTNFVEALSSVVNDPIIFAESRPNFVREVQCPPALRITFSNLADLDSQLHKKLGELPTKDPYFGFNLGCLEPTTMWRNSGSVNTISAPPIDGKVEIKHGFVSSDGAIRIMAPDLETLKWSKKLILNPLYANQPLVFDVKRSREEVVIRTLAQALGATVTETKTTVSIEPDYAKFPILESNTAQWISTTIKPLKEEYEALALGYKRVTAKQEEEVFTKKLQRLELPANQFDEEFRIYEKKALDVAKTQMASNASIPLLDVNYDSGAMTIGYLTSAALFYEAADGSHGVNF